MSKLSVWFHQVADWAGGAVANATPEKQQAAQATADALKAAATAFEAAAPQLVELAVDALLTGLGGGKYVPDFNSLCDMISAEVLKRKTPSA